MTSIVLGTINAKWIHPSLALRLLKANLPPALNTAKNSIVLEFAQRQRLEEKIAAVLAEKPGILALSVSIWNHEAVLELLKALEKEWAWQGSTAESGAVKPIVVLGGPEITHLPPEAEVFRHANFVIRGEGEMVFAELCKAILEDSKAEKTQFGKFITANDVDVSTIKSAYDLYTDEDLQHKLIYVESSRGCPFNCAFCQSAVKGSAAALREFPLKPFLNDLDRLLERCRGKSRTIKFLDRSFNVNSKRAVEILNFCLGKTGEGFQFHFEMVPGFFSVELQNILVKFPPGSIRLELGIQSLNQKTCAAIHRTSDPEKELDTLRFLREKTNAIIHADLIAGLPGEDIVSFGKGFDRLWTVLSQVDKKTPFEIQPGILKILPGTPIYSMAKEKSFTVVYNENPPYEVLKTDCMPAADMEKIKNFARFWELIVNRCPFPDLLSVLVSEEKIIFNKFMDLSEKLLSRFGKNWGISKQELEIALRD